MALERGVGHFEGSELTHWLEVRYRFSHASRATPNGFAVLCAYYTTIGHHLSDDVRFVDGPPTCIACMALWMRG